MLRASAMLRQLGMTSAVHDNAQHATSSTRMSAITLTTRAPSDRVTWQENRYCTHIPLHTTQLSAHLRSPCTHTIFCRRVQMKLIRIAQVGSLLQYLCSVACSRRRQRTAVPYLYTQQLSASKVT